jgi:hypothetical protein
MMLADDRRLKTFVAANGTLQRLRWDAAERLDLARSTIAMRL